MLTPINREIELLSPLTFAIVGFSHDHQSVTPIGTGFFIAPYVGLTARHIAEGLWKDLAPEWKQNRYPRRSVVPEFSVRLFQMIDPRAPYALAEWEVTGCTRAGYTDVAFLNIVPNNTIAERHQWPAGFPELQLTAPTLGSAISVVGYPGMRANYTPGVPGFSVDAALRVEDGYVIAHHDQGRGTWRYPQYQTTASFAHGMSGAPVVHDGRICGMVSYAATYRDGTFDSYAASLWPLLLQEIPANIDPRLNNLPFPDLVRQCVVRARGWREIYQQAYVDRTDPERPIAAMRIIVAG